MNNKQYLPGCGVLVVSWIGASGVGCVVKRICEVAENDSLLFDIEQQYNLAKKVEGPGNGPYPRISGRWLRAKHCLQRFKINTYEQLERLQSRDFQSWPNYGEKTHAELVAFVKSKGYKIAEW